MNAAAARADRAKQVRDAARAWAKAGAIDDAVRARVDAAYPEDRHRLRLGLRIVAFAAAYLGGIFLAGAIAMTLRMGSTGTGVLLLVFAAALAFATEYQLGPLRRADAGMELATAWLAGIFACVSLVVIAEDLEAGWMLTVAALVFSLGAYRWGFASLAAAASVFALLALARLPWGRAWWIAACLVAIVVVPGRAGLERLAPAHRRCLRVVIAAALLGLYFAIHYDGVKGGLVESIGDVSRRWGQGATAAAAVATAVLPMAVLVYGVRRRDKLAIAIGALLVGVSLGTWRFHWPWLPLWLTLTAGGVACFVTATLVRRFLDRSPAREWRGITADPLFDDPAHTAALRAAAVAATLGHAPQAASGDRPFQAGGGTSGGGGAQGQF
jgi:hypothetical protein